MIKYSKYILSFSFGNLHAGTGGVDKYVITQQKIANANNIGYFYLFYIKKMIKGKIVGFRFGLIIDGKYIGIFTTKQVIKMLQVNQINIEKVYINHLLFSKIKEVDKILSYVKKDIYLVLHDYYTCCTNYFLVKDNNYCNVNKLGDLPCLNCRHYKYSLKKENEIWHMLSKYKNNLYFISVSNCTKNIFLKFHADINPDRVIVVPNQNIIYGEDDSCMKTNAKLKIAYLGNDNINKGWNEFKFLVDKFKNSYDFYLFNSFGKQIDGAKTINAKYDSNHINGMVDFVKEENIDAVVLWAKWPETFSYVACESLASKCYMIGYKNSGNIVDIINNNKSGKVYNSFNDLINDMSDINNFTKSVTAYRKSLVGINISNVDNKNLVYGLTPESNKLQNHSLKLSLNINIINVIFDKYLKRKYKMEDI